MTDLLQPKPMTKAHFVLKCLISARRLKTICAMLDVSYKYAYSVANGLQNPSANIQKGLYPLIPPSYWHQDSTPEFSEFFKNRIVNTMRQNTLDLF